MDLVIVLLAVPVGLLVGGFVTMLVDRIPDRTPLSVRSRCPHCGHQLGRIETTPVVSWFVRRGRCRHCGDAITPAYPVVELASMGLVVLVAIRFGWDWTILPPLVMVVSLLALSVIDIYVYRLPDRLVFPALLLSAVGMVVAAVAIDRPGALLRALAGLALYGGILLVLHLVSPRGMGFGDVKLSLLLGLHLGWVAGTTWIGWVSVFRLVFYALLLGCLIGVIGGLLLAVTRRVVGTEVLADPEAVAGQPTRLLSHSMPFGPALAAGTVIVVLLAENFA